MRRFKGYFFILGATLFWGISATVAKFLFTRQVNTLVLVQTRMTISCLIMLTFFLLWKPGVLRVRPKDLVKFGALGIFGSAGSNFTYYTTIKEINVATAILLQYLAPLLVLAYAAITKEERITSTRIGAAVVSLVGCFLAVGADRVTFSAMSNIGLLTGFSSAFCWGFANIMIRHLLRKYSVWTTLCYSFLAASLFWLCINPPWTLIAEVEPASMWGILSLFAVSSILIPHSLYYSGAQYLTASQSIITGTAEPIVAISSAFVLIGESLSGLQLLGATLVIVAIMLLQLKDQSEQPLQPEPVP